MRLALLALARHALGVAVEVSSRGSLQLRSDPVSEPADPLAARQPVKLADKFTMCKGTRVYATQCIEGGEYEAAAASVQQQLEGYLDESGMPEGKCTDASCPLGDFISCTLRVVGHDSMDFDPDAEYKGGLDGCADLGASEAGLECLGPGQAAPFMGSLPLAYADHCSKLSLPDFLAIAGETVLRFARSQAPGHPAQGGHAAGFVERGEALEQALQFQRTFRFGRAEVPGGNCTAKRVPVQNDCSDQGLGGVVDRLGLTWPGAAALMGLHALGRAHKSNSGIEGEWRPGAQRLALDNKYYASLLVNGWEQLATKAWHRVDKSADAGATDELRLGSDLCLAHDVEDAEGACCAWVHRDVIAKGLEDNPERQAKELQLILDSTEHAHCGIHNLPLPHSSEDVLTQRKACCGADTTDCGQPSGRDDALDAVRLFAYDDQAWLSELARAWYHVTGNHWEAGQKELLCMPQDKFTCADVVEAVEHPENAESHQATWAMGTSPLGEGCEPHAYDAMGYKTVAHPTHHTPLKAHKLPPQQKMPPMPKQEQVQFNGGSDPPTPAPKIRAYPKPTPPPTMPPTDPGVPPAENLDDIFAAEKQEAKAEYLAAAESEEDEEPAPHLLTPDEKRAREAELDRRVHEQWEAPDPLDNVKDEDDKKSFSDSISNFGQPPELTDTGERDLEYHEFTKKMHEDSIATDAQIKDDEAIAQAEASDDRETELEFEHEYGVPHVVDSNGTVAADGAGAVADSSTASSAVTSASPAPASGLPGFQDAITVANRLRHWLNKRAAEGFDFTPDASPTQSKGAAGSNAPEGMPEA